MSDNRRLNKAALTVWETAANYLKGQADARELDQAVELWLLEREKVRAR